MTVQIVKQYKNSIIRLDEAITEYLTQIRNEKFENDKDDSFSYSITLKNGLDIEEYVKDLNFDCSMVVLLFS